MATTGAEERLYCGADLHANNVFLTLCDSTGKRVMERRVKANLNSVNAALEPYWSRIDQVAVESTFNWYWFVDGLRRDGRDVRLANPAACTLLGYSARQLQGMPVDRLVPLRARERHADLRSGYAKSPRARAMGTQSELAALRRDGSEVMVEIALSPLQEQGLPYVVAAIRGIGSYPRVRQALQRAHYAEQVALFGRLAVDARDPEPLVEQLPRVAVEGLQVGFAAVYLLQANRLDFRVAACAGAAPGESVGDIVPNRQDTLPGHVLAEASALSESEYDSIKSGAEIALEDIAPTMLDLLGIEKPIEMTGQSLLSYH